MSPAHWLPWLLAAAAASACSSSPPGAANTDFSAPPLFTVTTASGALRVEVRSSPQPPERGTNRFELRVVGATDGLPRDGLDVAVTPWMPSMNHGSSILPTVAAEGDGTYLVTNVDLFMPGYWE